MMAFGASDELDTTWLSKDHQHSSGEQHMRIRPVATLVSIAALAAFGTACEDPGGSDDSASKPPATEQPDSNPSEEPEKSEDREQPEKPEKDVDGDLGKTLDLGESTLVAHTSRSTESTLEVTTKTVKQGKLSDLETVRLDSAERDMQPYYVTVDFKNVDGAKPRTSTLQTSIELRDNRGEKAKSIFTMDDDVTDCVNQRPDSLAKGDTLTTCRVYLVAKGEEPKVVAYRSDFKKEPVFWKAEQ